MRKGRDGGENKRGGGQEEKGKRMMKIVATNVVPKSITQSLVYVVIKN